MGPPVHMLPSAVFALAFPVLHCRRVRGSCTYSSPGGRLAAAGRRLQSGVTPALSSRPALAAPQPAASRLLILATGIYAEKGPSRRGDPCSSPASRRLPGARRVGSLGPGWAAPRACALRGAAEGSDARQNRAVCSLGTVKGTEEALCD